MMCGLHIQEAALRALKWCAAGPSCSNARACNDVVSVPCCATLQIEAQQASMRRAVQEGSEEMKRLGAAAAGLQHHVTQALGMQVCVCGVGGGRGVVRGQGLFAMERGVLVMREGHVCTCTVL